jgi:rare lipoprotein A
MIFRLAVIFLFVIGINDWALSAESGIAATYPVSYKGRRMASGERFNPDVMMCAHRRHPFGSALRVTIGSRSITCRVNDRGPFVKGRIIDVSPAGARALGFSGIARVTVEPM